MVRSKRSSKALFLTLLVLALSVVMFTGCQSQPVNQSVNSPAPVGEKEPEAAVVNTTVEGFPPPTPHAIEGRDNCGSCHNEGVGGASKTPHPELTVCRQCHV
ncbi:hypothetical protein [Desulfitobacterium sp. PCE1]|uniref:hypothetical protein n=1 Tax=Desulfitobacterium sp. PCE1 TaxID=146907 RepID=UPI000377AD1F|nr:hypothetical protein [Desulfitobacterium sp. PCE1]